MSEGPSQLAAAIKRGDAARVLALLEGMGAPALLQAVECPWGGSFSRCPKGCSGNLQDDDRQFGGAEFDDDDMKEIGILPCNNHQACSVGAPGCQRSQARRAALTALSLPLWPLCPVTCGYIPVVCCGSRRSDLPKFRHCSSCDWQACPNCNVEHATGTVLHIAAHCNMGADVMCRLLDLGGRELLDRPDSTGKTARQLASDQSHTAVVSEIDRWSSQAEVAKKEAEEAGWRAKKEAEEAAVAAIAGLDDLMASLGLKDQAPAAAEWFQILDLQSVQGLKADGAAKLAQYLKLPTDKALALRAALFQNSSWNHSLRG